MNNPESGDMVQQRPSFDHTALPTLERNFSFNAKDKEEGKDNSAE
jgi:hypothetical protein